LKRQKLIRTPLTTPTRTQPRAAYLGVLAITSCAVLSLPAGALAQAPVDCGSQTTANVGAALAAVSGELATTETRSRDATAGSPASWRLHDDLNWLEWKYGLLRQLGDIVATRHAVTPGSPAQWRAQESADAVCGQLRLDA
jgi:hypothetical protein